MPFALLVGLAACFKRGANASESPNRMGASQVQTADGLLIRGTLVEEVAEFGRLRAPADQKILALNLEITNNTMAAISLAPSLFRARSSDDLERGTNPDVLSALDDVCGADTLLAVGGQTHCSLAFLLPFGTHAVALVYTQSLGQEVVMPLYPGFVCTECSHLCVDTRADTGNCGECSNALNGLWSCENGEAVCNHTICGGRCVDISRNLEHCGGCNQRVPEGGRCQTGASGCSANALECDSECVNPRTDAEHCGECSHRCDVYTSWARCEAGACIVRDIASPSRISCDAVCRQGGLRCVDGSAEAFYEFTDGDGCAGGQDSEGLDCSTVPDATVVYSHERTCTYAFEFIKCDCTE